MTDQTAKASQAQQDLAEDLVKSLHAIIKNGAVVMNGSGEPTKVTAPAAYFKVGLELLKHNGITTSPANADVRGLQDSIDRAVKIAGRIGPGGAMPDVDLESQDAATG